MPSKGYPVRSLSPPSLPVFLDVGHWAAWTEEMNSSGRFYLIEPLGRQEPATRYARIYELVRAVQAGQVATYGQITFIAELSTARTVGYALATLPSAASNDPPIPWHRIINSQGRISKRRDGNADSRQRTLLTAEGVLFRRNGAVEFKTAGWEGPSWEWLEANGYDVGAIIARSQLLRRTGQWVRWAL